MNPLVVYYSRTGITKKIAESISKELNCDLEEIVSKRGRNGPFGFLYSGYEAHRRKLAEIGETKNDPSAYDLVIIGTPIWSGRMSSPIRTYITKNKDRFQKVAFFITFGGMDLTKAMAELEDLCGKKSAGTLLLTTEDVSKDKYLQSLNEFAAKISKGEN
jgi:flavodoxin